MSYRDAYYDVEFEEIDKPGIYQLKSLFDVDDSHLKKEGEYEWYEITLKAIPSNKKKNIESCISLGLGISMMSKMLFLIGRIPKRKFKSLPKKDELLRVEIVSKKLTVKHISRLGLTNEEYDAEKVADNLFFKLIEEHKLNRIREAQWQQMDDANLKKQDLIRDQRVESPFERILGRIVMFILILLLVAWCSRFAPRSDDYELDRQPIMR